MIKLNDICIQYTAWCRRDTATSLTHTPWSTRLGPARSQHTVKITMRLRIREESTRGTGSESRAGGGRDLFPLRLAGENQKYRSTRVIPPVARVEQPRESIATRRVDYNRRKSRARNRHGRRWRKRRNRIGPRIRDNPCVLHIRGN